MALLVQKEIKCSNSALVLLDTKLIHIEAFDKDIKNAVEGSGSSVFARTVNNEDFVKKEGIMPDFLFNAYEELRAIIDCAKQTVIDGDSIHLEIGFTSTQTFVFQVNNVHGKTVSEYLAGMLPSKSEAMRWYYEVGLFKGKKLKIYSSPTKEVLYDNILIDFGVEKPITIRCSYKNQVNLRRYFPKTKDELQQSLEDLYSEIRTVSEEWDVIVYEYLNVRRSFELLLNKKGFLLEHVPGMWESENILNPDVLYLDDGVAKTWIWNEERETLNLEDNSNPEENNYYN